MFKRFFSSLSSSNADELPATKDRIKSLVAEHLRRLAIRRADSITVDQYGNIDARKWADEVKLFMDSIVRPQLTGAQIATLTDANLSLIGNELIETPVRLECKRMHDFRERDMTIRVVDKSASPKRSMVSTSVQNGAAKASHTSGAHAISRGLIIRQQPLDLILCGDKTWEMRSSNTNIRETIGLICKGSKAVYGVAEIVDSKGPLTDGELLANIVRHGISSSRLSSPEVLNYRFAWVLRNVQRFSSPIPYTHKGGVKFVSFDLLVQSKIAQELSK